MDLNDNDNFDDNNYRSIDNDGNMKNIALDFIFQGLGSKTLKNKQDKLWKYLPILEIPKRSFFPYISFRSSPKLISFPSYAVSQT